MRILAQIAHPDAVKAQYPISSAAKAVKDVRDAELAAIISSVSNKFLLIMGPCSVDNHAALDAYAARLAALQNRVSSKIFIMMRVYTQKPRTFGTGYKGILHSPDAAAAPDMAAGVFALRRAHHIVLEDHGLTTADELLYTGIYPYFDDLVSYLAIGARSVENQMHRLISSGVNVPVGMKNPISGSMAVMFNSCVAAQVGHRFMYRDCEMESDGNPLAHVILRGFHENNVKHANYHVDDLHDAARRYSETSLANPCVIIDASHDNSDNNYLLQPEVAMEIIASRNANPDLRKLIKGMMIESYIEDGRQEPGGDVFGQSITDACLGWNKTEELIYQLYDKL